MRAARQTREAMVRYARALHQKGWVANHDGNLSARIGERRFLATPTATSKEDVSDSNLLEVNDQGERVSGTSRRFSEINLHLTIYGARKDVAAVVHAHPPNATALACSGRNLIERAFLPEAVVSLGPEIPLVPFALPGSAAAEALAPYAGDFDAVLLERHGALTWGQTLEQAYLRMELVEHLATIALAAEFCGGLRPLSDDDLDPLLAARAKAGLGAAADRAVSRFGRKTVAACAPAPHSRVRVQPLSKSSVPSEVTRIIRDEIARALAEGD